MAMAGIEIRTISAIDGNQLSPVSFYTFDINDIRNTTANRLNNPIPENFGGSENIQFTNTKTVPLIIYDKRDDCWAFAVSADQNVIKPIKFDVIYDGGIVNYNYKFDSYGMTEFYNEKCNRTNKQIQHFVAKYPVKTQNGNVEAYTIVTLYNGKHDKEVVVQSDAFKNEFLRKLGITRNQSQRGA